MGLFRHQESRTALQSSIRGSTCKIHFAAESVGEKKQNVRLFTDETLRSDREIFDRITLLKVICGEESLGHFSQRGKGSTMRIATRFTAKEESQRVWLHGDQNLFLFFLNRRDYQVQIFTETKSSKVCVFGEKQDKWMKRPTLHGYFKQKNKKNKKNNNLRQGSLLAL